MLVERLYVDPPPPLRSLSQDKPTILVSWWCTGFALVIIVFRLVGRYIRTERLFREDKVMAFSLIPLFARMGLIHVVLIWGTNNTATEGLSELEIRHREIGSRLVLASRIMYAAFLWVQKLSIAEFFRRIIAQFWKRSFLAGLSSLKWFLLVTFLAVVITTLSECQPFTHYWQVVPDPGPQCRQGYAQLLTMATVDVITDFLLVVFPIPIIIRSQMPMKRKFQLVFLFALSLIPAAITIYRVPSIIDRHGRQQFRTLWASAEILSATAVANALVLGSFVRDRGPKKMKWKFGSTSDSLSRPTTRRRMSRSHWGSDEDLVRGLGLSLDPELRATDSVQKVRPAPMAVPARVPLRSHRPPPLTSGNWQFPPDSEAGSDIDLKVPAAAHSPSDMSIISPRRVSFFDVGGLLEDGSSPLSRSTTTTGEFYANRASTNSRDYASTPPPSSRVLLQDIGGLLSSHREARPTPQPRPVGVPGRLGSVDMRLSPTTANIDHTTINNDRVPPPPETPPRQEAAQLQRPNRNQSFQDVGGLLSTGSKGEYHAL
ncbi:MAG: hypothetical protein M1837_002171 [Sclerophora amabilis]|nr:MAG: hypothetical protein M1837_002171 [Sclerophora amabilis]